MRTINTLLPSASWIRVLIDCGSEFLGFDPAVRHVPDATPQGKVFDLLLGKQGNGGRPNPAREKGINQRREVRDDQANGWFTKTTHNTISESKLLPHTPRFTSPIGMRFRMSAPPSGRIETQVENKHDKKASDKTVKENGLRRRSTGVSEAKEKRHADLTYVAPA